MPHVIVKMFSGRSEGDKQRLANRVALAVMNSLDAADQSISVSVEDVDPADWSVKVYDPEILGRPDIIYKKPGYGRF